ncbi:hypothetical protein B0H13DRAFT_1536432, partial [Mycena leptocephala]
LDKAIDSYRVGLSNNSGLHPALRVQYLGKMATALQARFFEADLHRGDLDGAVNLLREKLSLQRPVDGADYLTPLADTLTERFRRFNDPSDIQEAIGFYSDALAHHPESQSSRGTAFNHLANALFEKSMFEDDSQALDECIWIYREGLTLAPLSDPSRARSYTNLAQAVRKRFDGVEIANYIDELRGLYREAAAL